MNPQFEKVNASPKSSFKVYSYQKAQFDAPWHFHPEYELTYIVQSQGVRYVGSQMMRFEVGDLVLLPPNLPHCWKNTSEHSGISEAIVVQWPKNLFGEKWLNKTEFRAISGLLEASSLGIQFGRDTAQKIVPILYQMLSCDGLQRLLLLFALLDHLAGSKAHRYLSTPHFAHTRSNRIHNRIDTVQDFVKEHYHRKITLTEVAGLVCMTDEAFCRFFKRTFGKTFFSYLNEYKICMACVLLLEGRQQVAQIAYCCGYESLPFFYRQFHKYSGMSPLAYRKSFASLD